MSEHLQLSVGAGLPIISPWTTPNQLKPIETLPNPRVLLSQHQMFVNKPGPIATKKVDFDPKRIAEPCTREDFLLYWCWITLNPNTANVKLSLSEENKCATLQPDDQKYPWHTDRFTFWIQVLSAEGFTGRRYWGLECTGTGGVVVAVTYKNLQRKGPSREEVQFGHNDSSWARPDSYKCLLCRDSVLISGLVSSWIGVYLDHTASLLSFYSVSQSMNLLYKVQTCFSQPLNAGLRLWYPDANMAFINPN